jgi:hypothetical protein
MAVQIIIFVLSILSLAGMGCDTPFRRAAGWSCSIFLQPFMAWTAYEQGQWGILLACVPFFFLSVRGFLKNVTMGTGCSIAVKWFKWEPRDLWLGLYWDKKVEHPYVFVPTTKEVTIKLYFCIVPCFPIIVTIKQTSP